MCTVALPAQGLPACFLLRTRFHWDILSPAISHLVSLFSFPGCPSNLVFTLASWVGKEVLGSPHTQAHSS